MPGSRLVPVYAVEYAAHIHEHRGDPATAAKLWAGATVRTEDLGGLRNLANLLGDRFVAGYVLYTGQQTLPFGEKLRALPLDALWCVAA